MGAEDIRKYKERILKENPGIKPTEVNKILICYMATLPEYRHEEGPWKGRENYTRIARDSEVNISSVYYYLNKDFRRKNNESSRRYSKNLSPEKKKEYNRNRLKKKNPEIYRLDEVNEWYKMHGRCDEFEFDEEDLNNSYFRVLRELPDYPDFWRYRMHNEKIDGVRECNRKVINVLSSRKLIVNISRIPDALRIYSRTRKGRAISFALETLESRLTKKI